MRFFVYLAAFILVATGGTRVQAEITATSFFGETYAELTPIIDADNSSQSNGLIESDVNLIIAYSYARLNWNLTDKKFAGSSTVDVGLTEPDEATRQHRAFSKLVFQFSIDSTTQYRLDGQWGFDSPPNPNDILHYELTGDSGLIFSKDASGITGPFSETIFEFGQLTAGNYILTFDAELDKQTGGDPQAFIAGWTIDQFLLGVTVPEPVTSSIGFLACLGFGFLRFRP